MAKELALHIFRLGSGTGVLWEVLDSHAKPKCAMEPLRHTSVVRFGTYEVSLQSGEVRKGGCENQSAAATDEAAENIARAPWGSGHEGGIARPSLDGREFW
jgi:hypothetical protein